jgi:hypothetical protein
MDKQEETRKGISLFKIDYEIDGQEGAMWSAGIVAYGSDEAVKSLTKHLNKTISGFKGFKITTLSFQGQVHHLSEAVREQIVQSSQIMSQTELKKEKKPKKKATDKKKSILK